MKITHGEVEFIDLSVSSHPLVSRTVKSTLSPTGTSAPQTPVRLAVNPMSKMLHQAPHAHEPSLYSETQRAHTSEELNFIEINRHKLTDSRGPSPHKDYMITSPNLQAHSPTQADPQSPLPDSSQPRLDNTRSPSSPTSTTSHPPIVGIDHGVISETLDKSQTPELPSAQSQHGELVSSSSPLKSRPADSWSLFSASPGPSIQSSIALTPQSTKEPAYGTRDSSLLTPHSTSHRSLSPDELLLEPPVPHSRHLQSPVIQRAREVSLPAVSSRDQLPLSPPPPPAIPFVIPEDSEPPNRYSLRRRQARQLQPYAYDKALYKAQMKANPDAIVKFVSRDTHAEDGSQWEDGQTQSGTQAEYIFPVDSLEDEDYVQVGERSRRRRTMIAEADRHNHEQEGGWLPEALRDLSDSDEIEGTDEVRKLAREAGRARRKAEAEAKKREKEEARLRAQEEAEKAKGKEATTKWRLKNFPLASASSSNQPTVGSPLASPRLSPSSLDEVRSLPTFMTC